VENGFGFARRQFSPGDSLREPLKRPMNVRKGASLVQGEVHSPFPRRMGEFLLHCNVYSLMPLIIDRLTTSTAAVELLLSGTKNADD
jgi:hypothetical protein